jgi:radical SAM protein with 4Fe4S-binding SPASM domain
MGYSVGIGLTNDCNLDCAHCYRDTAAISYLSLGQVKQICQAIPVDAMGLGTGENALHPDFAAIIGYLRGRGIKLSMASNGYSLTVISDETLRAFNDVEVSIDFPTQVQQDDFRGKGNWHLVHQAIERCQKLGVEVSILTTLMRPNYDQMDQMVTLARRRGVNLRVNAYQAVRSDAFRLSYDEFWEGYRRLFAEGLVVACSEPVVRAVMGLGPAPSPCGHQSVRINPRGQVIPCVYWPVQPGEALHVSDLQRLGTSVIESEAFRQARQAPSQASSCQCGGGCASRRALHGQMGAHDDYCPWVREGVVHLPWRPAPAKNLMRIGNVCTTVVL